MRPGETCYRLPDRGQNRAGVAEQFHPGPLDGVHGVVIGQELLTFRGTEFLYLAERNATLPGLCEGDCQLFASDFQIEACQLACRFGAAEIAPCLAGVERDAVSECVGLGSEARDLD